MLMRHAVQWSIAASLVLMLASCKDHTAQPYSLAGPTMGTGYLVKLWALPAGVTLDTVRPEVVLAMEQIEGRLSGWRAESEIARFNDNRSSDWFAVSADTARVLIAAQRIAKLSGGAFDVTVSPLVDLWGFGTTERQQPEPDQKSLSQARAHVGWRKLQVRARPPALRKLDPALRINLGAIAKGHAVDRVAEALDELGVKDYLVEIGGEVRGKGQRPDGRPWRIGIERPAYAARDVQRVVALSGRAMATSGDYRNYRDLGGKRVSHIIDPRSGRPIEHGLASVSVIAASCMEADALATALMVLGTKEGLPLAEREGISALFISRGRDGFISRGRDGLLEKASSAFLRELEAIDQPRQGVSAAHTSGLRLERSR